jgi:hypothetical protein
MMPQDNTPVEIIYKDKHRRIRIERLQVQKRGKQLVLYLAGAEELVRILNALGMNAYWENYDIIVYTPNRNALFMRNGLFRDNKWVETDRIRMRDDGTWLLPKLGKYNLKLNYV